MHHQQETRGPVTATGFRPWALTLGWALVLFFCLAPATAQDSTVVRWWSSSEDLAQKLTPRPELRFAAVHTPRSRAIRVDDHVTCQTVLGLGSSLEHSTCYNLMLLPPDRRRQVLDSLLHPETGIGMNLMRICIGTPDFTASPWYTYDDMPAGQKDSELKHFSIARDREYVLPVLKAARQINPALRFFASPWSPPGWMKTNDRIGGGAIDARHFPQFAEYLARFVEAYRDEGIEIHALTIQNEPEYAPDSYPTCRWTAAQQRDFIRDHLGPLLRARNLRTLIWCFDHNFNHPDFPATILRDPAAAQYVDGTAFHLYEGKPEAMLGLQRRFPDKHLYFTEGSTFGAQGAAQIVSFFRNGSRSYNAWVTLIDHRGQPNPGPHGCSPTCIVLNRDTLELGYRFDYYMYGQFMKFIQAGAVRLASTSGSRLAPNVAFRNPDGHLVLVVVNGVARSQKVEVNWRNRGFTALLEPKSVATFSWAPDPVNSKIRR